MRVSAWFVTLALMTSTCFAAETFPAQPVRVVVAFAPGGGADLIARLIAPALGEQLGATVIVDNRGGAGGRIGTEVVAKAPPNGYTLLLGETGFVTNPGYYRSLPYDSLKDFTPISHFVRDADVLVVSPALKVGTLKEFIALAQANPGKFNYGASPVGSFGHLKSELFKIAAKVNLVHVPYKGGGETVTALLGGQIQMTFNSAPNVVAHVASGKLRALAVTTAPGKRLSQMPDVPSFAEAGIPDMTIYAWNGLIAPAGMPKDIVVKLHDAFVKALALPAVRERYLAIGGDRDTELVGSSPEEFAAYIRSEIRRWGDVIKAAGITPEQ